VYIGVGVNGRDGLFSNDAVFLTCRVDVGGVGFRDVVVVVGVEEVLG
jgi:hypothetical protein